MAYSFTLPKKKELFSLNTKIWMGVFGISIAIIVVFDIFLFFTRQDMMGLKESFSEERSKNISEIIKLEEVFTEEKDRVLFAEGIETNNQILAESIKNLFELIPDQITVDSIKMEEKKLEIRGVTPSKDVYEFLLAAPLKSIFATSNVSFYRLSNGWYNFVSINEIDEGGAIFE